MSVCKVKTSDGEVKWEVRVYESGRGSRRIRRRFDRKVDADDFLRESRNRRQEQKANPFKQRTFEGRTFRGETEYWYESGKLRYTVSHLKRVDTIMNELLKRFGDLPIEAMTPERISKFQQDEKARGLENGTVNRKTAVIASILNHSVKHRRIPYNPATGFRKLSVSAHEMAFWTPDEAKGFLGTMNERYPKGSPDRWVYVAYLLALNTGLRAGEIWGLKAMDLARDGMSIIVRRQFNRVTLDFSETKGKKARAVPCHEVLRAELFELIERKAIRPDETIFLNEVRRPICHDNFLKRQFTPDLKAWNGRAIRFHDLRHTATTLLIANGIDIKTVKEICGHADIATTMNYVHMLSGSVENVAKTFVIAPPESSRKEVLSLIKSG